MQRTLCGFAALAMIVASAMGATDPTSKKKAPTAKAPAAQKIAQKPAQKPAQKKPLTPLQKSVAQKRSVTAASARKKTAPAPAVTWRNRQLQPTQDRFKEIQTALASRGYLQPEQATGTWDQNSTEAMKQFQSTQSLDASGKINALSLIALGLGPRHDAPPVQTVQPVEQYR